MADQRRRSATSMPIALAISALMAIVVLSYRQTVKAYPNGGGAYIVSKENLGETSPGWSRPPRCSSTT